jgi:hypothetical protein
MQLQWAVVGVVVAGAALWKLVRQRRRKRETVQLSGDRIRNAARLVAGGGVRRMD